MVYIVIELVLGPSCWEQLKRSKLIKLIFSRFLTNLLKRAHSCFGGVDGCRDDWQKPNGLEENLCLDTHRQGCRKLKI